MERNCPFCKKTGLYPEWKNDIIDEVVKEQCDFCDGTAVCDQSLIDEYNEMHKHDNDELPF